VLALAPEDPTMRSAPGEKKSPGAADFARRGQQNRHIKPPRAPGVLNRERAPVNTRDAHTRPETDAPEARSSEYVGFVRGLLRGEEDRMTRSMTKTHRSVPDARARFLDLDHPIPVTSQASRPKAQPWPASWATGFISGCRAAGDGAECCQNARRAPRKPAGVPGGLHTAAMVKWPTAEAGRGRPILSTSSRSAEPR